MPDALLKDGNILRSKLAQRYLLDMATHAIGTADVITLRISVHGLDFTCCDVAHVVLVEFHLASEEFDEFEAAEGEFPIDTELFLDAVKKARHLWDTATLIICPDKLIIGEGEREIQLPRSNLSRTHIPREFDIQARSRFESGFLKNILRQLGECIVEIELSDDGPIILTKRTEPDGMVIRYTLAPLVGDWEAGVI